MNKNNVVRTVGVRQIEKNSDLTLGVPQKDIAKYEKIVTAYGNVTPAVVAGADGGGMFRLIDGYARVEACVRAGINEIPVVVAQVGSDADNIKLSLLLSASREQGSPISEGALIEKLTNEHGHTLGELSKLFGRSKSWLSKRQTMARNLSQPLKDMILSGAICARTAEEIAKLPYGEQAVFAANVVKDGLSKDEVHGLVRQYRSPDATIELCSQIIESPATLALALRPRVKTRKLPGDMGVEARACRTAHLAIDILNVIGKILTEHDEKELEAAQSHLLKLRRKMRVVDMMIAVHVKPDNCPVKVSPGKYVGISPGKSGGGSDD